MKKELTKEQLGEMEELTSMPDKEIDYSDIPSVQSWEGAVVGKFYRPIKQAVTIHLDSDVVSWLKQGGRGYLARVNQLLRSAMEKQSEDQRHSTERTTRTKR